MGSIPKLRWGILGTASIARRRVIPALQASSRGTVAGVASRDRARAEPFARELGIARAFASYEELLASEAIDAVYIPLPNDLHVEWSIRALAAGKHVLCEKPIGMDRTEAVQLLHAARQHPHLTVMEAFMYRCHPRWLRVRELVTGGAIGELGTVLTIFSYDNRDPANIRNNPTRGGGGWLDIGCYGVSVARFLFGGEPSSVEGQMEIDPVFHVDRLASAVLRFEGGTATVTCATQLQPYQSVSVLGSRGRIELDWPFNAPSEHPTTINLFAGDASDVIEIPPCNQYREMAERFAEAVFEGKPVPVSLEDSVANMAVLDEVVSRES